LEAATSHSNTIDSEARRLFCDIESFIGNSTADSFKNRAVVTTALTTADLFRDLPDLQHLEVQLNCLVQLSGQSCLERDNVGDEKNNVIKRIGADNRQPNNVKNTRTTEFTRPIGRHDIVFIVLAQLHCQFLPIYI